MPRKPEVKEEPKTEATTPLRPFTVFIGGEDRTVFASDEQDLQEQIAKLREIASK